LEHASVITLWIAFLLYAGAFAYFLYHLFSKRAIMNRIGMILAAGGLVFHAVALITRGIDAGHLPVVGAYESLVLVAFSLTLVYHVLESFTRIQAIGLYVMPVVLLLLTVAWTRYEAPGALVPALRGDIVGLHAMVTLLAAGCLYVAGGAAIIYLIERGQLKRRHLGPVLGRLPSLGALDKLVYHAVLLGLPFLTMGMVAGVIRAVTYHVSDWWFDPLVLLALALWAVYVVLLWGHMRRGWGGSKASWLAITGLVLLFVIRFAAIPYLSNFHKYGA
jgi:ABC-type uncharacterized transport system permease subunit